MLQKVYDLHFSEKTTKCVNAVALVTRSNVWLMWRSFKYICRHVTLHQYDKYVKIIINKSESQYVTNTVWSFGLKFSELFSNGIPKRKVSVPPPCVSETPPATQSRVPFNPRPKDLDRGVFLSKYWLLTPSLPGCLVDRDLSKAALNSAWLSASKYDIQT